MKVHVDRVVVEHGTYRDSMTLMLLSRDARALDHVEEAFSVMATPVNLEILARRGFTLSEGSAGPNDLVIAVRADDESAAEAAGKMIRERLTAPPAGGGSGTGAPVASHRNVRTLARGHPEIGVLAVSVPGDHAAYEVASGLEAGLHVFCFSSGVSVEDERALKVFALERGLLLMGPDCGTAILDGIGFGFANAVRPGPVGLVGASGTGLQEVSCLLDAAGLGISHAIGVGSRDLSTSIGGLMTSKAIDVLAADDSTETIVVISKPPDLHVAAVVAERAARAGKPVVLGFLGAPDEPGPVTGTAGRVRRAATLEGAAAMAASLHGLELPEAATPPLGRSRGYVRGLFCGGTLCHEAMAAASPTLGLVRSNMVAGPDLGLDDPWEREGHAFVDFGDERLTEGRLHPMIDPSVRNEQALRDALDPDVGVVVLDVVLGFGANEDPATDVAAMVRTARAARGAALGVVVTLCGTPSDPQDVDRQRGLLEDAGCAVTMGARRAGQLAAVAVAAGGGLR